MKPPAPRAPLQASLGYTFRDPQLLEQALTHPSSRGTDNQRLEFLGDALLNAIVALLIFRMRSDWEEGAMSKLRNLLVRTETLAAWAEELGVTLRQAMGKAQGRMGAKPMADAMEAVLGAVFLDAGPDGFLAIHRIVEARFGSAIQEAHEGLWIQGDPKTTLQERAAALGLPKPAYQLLSQSGPDHAPRFRVQVGVGNLASEAEGNSRKSAEVEAARLLLTQLPKD